MDQSSKHKVSLRGASAKEISRDALLEKVAHERELRNYTRRANAAALCIQRVWRRYSAIKKVALKLQEEWENSLKHYSGLKTRNWVSSSLLRPFLFFIGRLSIQHGEIQARDIDCIKKCYSFLLESLNSTDSMKNFCSLAVATQEERRIWTYQTRKLIRLCSLFLVECDRSHEREKDVCALASLALRVIVILTDVKSWKSITESYYQEAEKVVIALVQYLGSHNSSYYISFRRHISTLTVSFSSTKDSTKLTDDKFLITASAITLALRPFHVKDVDSVHSAIQKYSSSVLTIPWLLQRVPPVLIPALKHKSVLLPCFKTLLISRDKILTEMSEINQSHNSSENIPPVGWSLANIICLATETENNFIDRQGLNLDLYYQYYVHVVVALAENLLARLDNIERQHLHKKTETSAEAAYINQLMPVCQQWHLAKLLEMSKKDAHAYINESLSLKDSNFLGKLKIIDIARFYSTMLRIFAALNSMVGPLPVLNMLSFTPGYLSSLWGALQNLLFPEKGESSSHYTKAGSRSKKNNSFDKKQKQVSKDGYHKWANVLHKFTGKSTSESDYIELVDDNLEPNQLSEDYYDIWDIEALRQGFHGISKDLVCLLHLFCATYSHLLLVLDDIEFYDKQVPFTLDQQRRIASMLNALVYNSLLQSVGPEKKVIMDSAIRCLHLLYGRDCRRSFCPPDLWLSPGRRNRPTIAVAARTHEILLADNGASTPPVYSVITTTPHVFPFEERVQMFREFISMDKVSRKMAGEVVGPGFRSIEIVVRRGHIVEDGFRQLNSLGTRLKSSINVSFVNESGLPEAGLDYGGLSKEFLTDISKTVFSPDYGLFSQTLTSDRQLVPNPAARHLENGYQMIEFLGKIVGKALYEGMLLDYSFSQVFVQKMFGRYSFLDELSTLDPELYKNLLYVKHYDGDIQDLSLDFTVTEESFGKQHVIELKSGGKDMAVTNENKMQYIHAMADYKLNRQMLPFSNAFYRGLTDLISPSWLKLFNANEFNQLLSGGTHDIDVDDLRNNTKYSGGYDDGSRTIKIFWEVFRGFEPEERCMLLKFVTSCSRQPLLGFKYLQPTFTIHKVVCNAPVWAAFGGQDVERLPSASTCYNTLKLPTYKRASTMREKLLYAISSNAGFELS